MQVLTISKITRQDSSSKQLHDCSLMLHYWVKYFFKKHSDDFQDQTKQKVKQTTKTKEKYRETRECKRNIAMHLNTATFLYLHSQAQEA